MQFGILRKLHDYTGGDALRERQGSRVVGPWMGLSRGCLHLLHSTELAIAVGQEALRLPQGWHLIFREIFFKGLSPLKKRFGGRETADAAPRSPSQFMDQALHASLL